jgi:enediyne biosynthesis protein E4
MRKLNWRLPTMAWVAPKAICLLVLFSSTMATATGFFRVEIADFAATRSGNGGASWGDYDDDGDIDLFVTLGQDGLNSLHRNLGGGVFDRPDAAEIGDLATDDRVAVLGVWADLNNDGHLDLYVANRRVASSGNRDHANDHIYWNDGNRSFTRQKVAGTSAANLLPHGVSLADFDLDGDLDVLEPTFQGSRGLPEAVFRNDGNGLFSRLEIANAPLTQFANNAAWGDFDGDGDLDVIVANNGGNAYILKNRLAESGAATFEPVTGGPEALGIDLTTTGAAIWGDCDNDGDLDLLTTHNSQGFRIHRRTDTEQYDSEPYYYLDGRAVLFAAWLDADNDGDLDLIATVSTGPTTQDYRLFVNEGDGRTFTEEFLAPGHPSSLSSAPAIGDFNNDGYPDLFMVHDGLPGVLYQNEGGDNHWLKLVLKGASSNGSGIGAIVRVKATIDGQEVWQMRQVSAGGEAYRVQHDLRPNFGLGDATVAEVVRIEWPSGTVQELTDVAADQILTVIEPPALSVEAAVILSWPVTAEGYDLFGAQSVEGPWMKIDTAVTAESGRSTVTVKAIERMRFYQLSQP